MLPVKPLAGTPIDLGFSALDVEPWNEAAQFWAFFAGYLSFFANTRRHGLLRASFFALKRGKLCVLSP